MSSSTIQLGTAEKRVDSARTGVDQIFFITRESKYSVSGLCASGVASGAVCRLVGESTDD